MSKWVEPSPQLIQRYRVLTGMTLAEAASAMKTTPDVVCNWENGKHKPTSKSLTKLAKAYDRDVSDFYLVPIDTLRSEAISDLKDYFRNPNANIDRRAAIAVDILARVPESQETGPENIAEQYPDFWRSIDLHPYESDNAKAVINYTGHELVVSGPTRCSKTLRILEYIFYLHFTHKGFKSLILRSDAVDLTSTIRASIKELLRYELDDPLSPVKARGGLDDFHTLKLNGGEMKLGGMNRPGRVLGTKYDLVFYSQIEQSDDEQYQKLKTRVSGDAGNWVENGKRRYLLIGDANPDRSDHYLIKRKKQDKLDWIDFDFEDNPLYFRNKQRTPEWSVVDELDDGLTGIWHDRYFKGLWKSPEGAVFTIEPENIVTEIPDLSECIIDRACDWGMDHPSICLWIAEHKETGDITVYREWRKTHTDIDEMGEEIKLYTGDEVIDATIIDHDENRQKLLRKNHGIHAQFAYKSAGSVMDGTMLMQAALRRAVEGKPGGLYIYDKLLCNTDPNPEAKELDLIKELQGLEFDETKDAPKKEDDDAFDALRYRFLYRAKQQDIPFIGEVITRNRPPALI